MRKHDLLILLAVAAFPVNGAYASDNPVGTIISQWNFNAQSFSPSLGSGTMSLVYPASYEYEWSETSPKIADWQGVDSTTGLPIVEQRKSGSGYAGSNSSSDPLSWVVGYDLSLSSGIETHSWTSNAPSGTEYAQWMIPTTGRSNIVVDMDVRVKAYCSRYFTLQYTTDGTHWANGLTIDCRNNPPGLDYGFGTGEPPIMQQNPSPDTQLYSNDRSLWYNNCAIDLRNVPAANNNPNFGFRFVPGKGDGTDPTDGLSSKAAADPIPCNDYYEDGKGFTYIFDNVTVTSVGTPTNRNWTGSVSSDWGVAANWSGTGNVPDSPGAIVTLGSIATSSTVQLTTNTITPAGRTVGQLTFAPGGTTIQSITPLTLDNGGNRASISLAGSNTITTPVVLNSDVDISGTGSVTFSGDISGPNGIRLLGGTLTLTGSTTPGYDRDYGTPTNFTNVNIYAGGTTVENGKLILGMSTALGTGGLTVDDGTVDLNGFSPIALQQISVQGGDYLSYTGTAGLPSFSGTGGMVLNNGAGSAVLTLSQTSTTTYSGTLADGASKLSLLLNGTGKLVLAGTNTYTGGTSVTGGTLVLASASSLKDGTSLSVGANAATIFGSSAAGLQAASQASALPSGGPTAVPEPGTAFLLTIAGVTLGLVCRRGSHRRRA